MTHVLSLPEPPQAPRWLVKLITDAKPELPVVPVFEAGPANGHTNGSAGKRKYAEKALASEAEKVRNAEPTTRNDTLNTAAFKCGTYLPLGLLSQQEVEMELTNAALSAGLGGDEIRKTLASGLRAGYRHPKQFKERFLAPLLRESLQDRKSRRESGGVEEGLQERLQASTEGASRWLEKSLSELQASTEALPWLWYGYLAKGMITLFTGLWKSGKTTLLSYLLKSMDGESEEFAGGAVVPCKILVVTEEAEYHWASRRDELQLADHISIISRPFLRSPNKAAWEAFLAHCAERVLLGGYDLVIFDSLHNLWSVKDENNAAEVRDAMMPLLLVAQAGAGVFCIAHPKKGDATQGQATRGSGATPGFVDIIMEMRRMEDRPTETRRVFSNYSRFDETPSEIVLDFARGKGYTAQGTKSEAHSSNRREKVLESLPLEEPGWTIDEVLGDWPEEEKKPARRSIASDLDYLYGKGFVMRRGEGKRNDPFRYNVARTDPAFLANIIASDAPLLSIYTRISILATSHLIRVQESN